MNNDKSRCPDLVNSYQRCILCEGHAGAHVPGPSPLDLSFDCQQCGKKFANLEEFDAHVACA
jgi:hypothetical protein